jgi:hypothetical protein
MTIALTVSSQNRGEPVEKILPSAALSALTGGWLSVSTATPPRISRFTVIGGRLLGIEALVSQKVRASAPIP